MVPEGVGTRTPECYGWNGACIVQRPMVVIDIVIGRMAMVNVAVPAREYARPPGARHRPQPAPTSQIHGFLEAKCAAKAF